MTSSGERVGRVEPSRPPAVRIATAVVAYLFTGAVLLAWVLQSPAAGIFRNDVPARYRPIAALSAPWVEEQVEFPPVAVAFLEPLVWFPREVSTAVHVGVQTLVVLAIVAVLLRYRGWPSVRRWLLWSAPLLPLMLLRVDLPSVLACVVALVLADRRREVAAGVAVAFGVLAKVWPGALVLALWRSHRRAAVTAVLASLAGTLLWMLLTATDAPVQVLGFRDAVGWHMESVVGSLVRLVDGGTPAIESGAWRFGDASVVPTVVLGLVALGLAWAVARRVDDLPRVLLTTLALGLVAAPLLSPQYAVWLLAPLVLVDDLRPAETVSAAGVVLGSLALTYWLMPIVEGTTLGWTVLLLRNLAVVALAVALTVTGLRTRRAAVAEGAEGAEAAPAAG